MKCHAWSISAVNNLYYIKCTSEPSQRSGRRKFVLPCWLVWSCLCTHISQSRRPWALTIYLENRVVGACMCMQARSDVTAQIQMWLLRCDVRSVILSDSTVYCYVMYTKQLVTICCTPSGVTCSGVTCCGMVWRNTLLWIHKHIATCRDK